jgi:hypothetical protein
MKKIGKFLTILFFLIMGSPAISADKFVICLKNNHFADNERIIGFEVKITSGKVDSFLSVPIGWSINIDNDPSWQTKITGSFAVGAAALRPDLLSNIIRIEKNESIDLRFNIEIDIIVTKDFEKERTIHLKMNDLILRKETKIAPSGNCHHPARSLANYDALHRMARSPTPAVKSLSPEE